MIREVPYTSVISVILNKYIAEQTFDILLSVIRQNCIGTSKRHMGDFRNSVVTFN